LFLTIAFLPLFFLGPNSRGIIGNLTSRGEREKDALAEGVLTGIIGGLIIGVLFIAGFGALSAIIDWYFAKIVFWQGQ
jgi:hypothetical protein